MQRRFDGQIALITGAATGIGRVIAERFASEGATAIIADINEKSGTEAVNAISSVCGKAVFQSLNVADKASADAAIEAIDRRFGRLDVHVNNAGVVHRAPFLDYSLDDWRRVIDINLTGAFICGQAAARVMAKAGGGRIINIASVSGQLGSTGRVAYGASKAGLIGLTQTMAAELGPLGVTVNAIAPGPTQVSRLSHGPKQREAFLSRMPLKRYALPDDIAAAVAFLASRDASHITGHILNVDGGFTSTGVLFDPADER